MKWSSSVVEYRREYNIPGSKRIKKNPSSQKRGKVVETHGCLNTKAMAASEGIRKGNQAEKGVDIT